MKRALSFLSFFIAYACKLMTTPVDIYSCLRPRLDRRERLTGSVGQEGQAYRISATRGML